MHLTIRSDIKFRFASPARNLTYLLRLSPRSHEGQHVTGARIDADIDCSLKAGQDAFGNVTHSFSANGPLEEFAVTSVCQVETYDAAGVVRGGAERLPVDIYLRETELTATDDALRSFASRTTMAETEPLGRLHALLDTLHDVVAFDEGAPDAAAAAAFAAKRGNARSHAQIFLACARHLGLPSRHVSGYYLRDRRAGRSETAAHAWSEAYVANLGWVGFDTVEKLCPKGQHVRVATGLDALGSAFFRGTACEGAVVKATISVG